MYEMEADWIEEMVQHMEKQDQELLPTSTISTTITTEERNKKEKQPWTPEEIEAARRSTEYWCQKRRLEDKQKTEDRIHRNADPELRAAKEAMLRASLKAIQQYELSQK